VRDESNSDQQETKEKSKYSTKVVSVLNSFLQLIEVQINQLIIKYAA